MNLIWHSYDWWLIGNHYLKGVPILSFVDCRQDGLIDPETHGRSDQSQGEVADHTENTKYQLNDACFCWLVLTWRGRCIWPPGDKPGWNRRWFRSPWGCPSRGESSTDLSWATSCRDYMGYHESERDGICNYNSHLEPRGQEEPGR